MAPIVNCVLVVEIQRIPHLTALCGGVCIAPGKRKSRLAFSFGLGYTVIGNCTTVRFGRIGRGLLTCRRGKVSFLLFIEFALDIKHPVKDGSIAAGITLLLNCLMALVERRYFLYCCCIKTKIGIVYFLGLGYTELGRSLTSSHFGCMGRGFIQRRGFGRLLLFSYVL